MTAVTWLRPGHLRTAQKRKIVVCSCGGNNSPFMKFQRNSRLVLSVPELAVRV